MDLALPERRLIGAIVGSAVSEAKTCHFNGVEAAAFLISDRVDRYLWLLGIEPHVFKEGLMKNANLNICGELSEDAKSRRLLRINIEKAKKLYDQKAIRKRI